MEIDARTLGATHALETEVCIVGGGPVGLTLAQALQAAGREVVVVDSGGYAHEQALAPLNAAHSETTPHLDTVGSRVRRIGGSATLWNSEIRTAACAKYTPLDADDFVARPWMPHSGWPFPRSTLDPYLVRAALACGLPALHADTIDDAARQCLPGRQPHEALTGALFQFGPGAHFWHTLPEQLRASSHATVLHDATITSLELDGTTPAVRAATWRTLNGRQGVIRARTVVLAAGAIENARLMLLQHEHPTRRPPPAYWLGRGFMEHPIDRSLVMTTVDPAVAECLRHFQPYEGREAAAVMGRLALPPTLRAALQVPNVSIRLEGRSAPLAVRTMARLRAVRHPEVRGAARFVQLLLDLEQAPHPDNRVTLSSARDQFDMPRAVVTWRWREADELARQDIREAVIRAFASAGFGTPRAVGSLALDPNAHHHAGTTRMHRDPDYGVVDEQLRTHGLRNLYVCGASVFPTAGALNPTLTAVALALRLADHLHEST